MHCYAATEHAQMQLHVSFLQLHVSCIQLLTKYTHTVHCKHAPVDNSPCRRCMPPANTCAPFAMGFEPNKATDWLRICKQYAQNNYTNTNAYAAKGTTQGKQSAKVLHRARVSACALARFALCVLIVAAGQEAWVVG